MWVRFFKCLQERIRGPMIHSVCIVNDRNLMPCKHRWRPEEVKERNWRILIPDLVVCDRQYGDDRAPASRNNVKDIRAIATT